MGVQQYGSQHATQPEGEVVMRYSLGKSYGTCLHVAGSVGDKPGPGIRLDRNGRVYTSVVVEKSFFRFEEENVFHRM